MDVREMKTSANGCFFIEAEFKDNICLVNTKTGEKSNEYKTHFESGGSRLSVSNSGKYFATAAYGRFGVSLYDSEMGIAKWTNKEIKRIQKLEFSNDESILYVINGDDVLYEISVENGTIENKTKGISDICVTIYGILFMKGNNVKWEQGDIKTNVNVLSLTRSEDMAFISILCGGLKAFEKNGDLKWSADNKKNEHYIRLAYEESKNELYALGYKFDSPRTEPFFFADVYDAANGQLKRSKNLSNALSFVFIPDKQKVIAADGNEYELSDKGE